jgi:hypothetical protein
MFERVDEEATTRRQRVDNALQDEEIERAIKKCQRENGECMKSTSGRLRKKYGDQPVTHVLNRLRQRRFRGNKYQEKESSEIMNLLSQLTTKKVNHQTFSL